MSIIRDIILCIRHSAQKYDEVKEVKSDDFGHTVSEEFQGVKGALQLKDYAPHVFRDVRRLCGITTPEYLGSWADPAPDQKLSQSSGRSGSMFYRTQDRQYFFKTLLHPEVGVMMDMLKDYHKYLSDAPKNFIMRVVGLYRLTYSPAKQIWVLVFKNVFPPGVAIDETYDLKGRKPKRTNTPVVGGGPVKDNQIQRQIYFTAPEVTQFYREQLNQDIDFLMKHNVMDYSLLVGVHYVTDQEREIHQNGTANNHNTKDTANKQSPEATHHSSSSEQPSNTNVKTAETPVNKSRSSSTSSSSSSSDDKKSG
jgi:1-phosphatidylinositol-4-phosphate 5-kinase